MGVRSDMHGESSPLVGLSALGFWDSVRAGPQAEAGTGKLNLTFWEGTGKTRKDQESAGL